MSKLIFTLSDISFSMNKNWFIDIFRALFAFFDFIVYFVIELLFRAVFNLSNFELYGMYEDIMDRVYVILGIFMLFKVTISLITYLVNPDKINDKEQGIGKLTTRVIIVLIMLIGLPTFFSLMTEAQNKLLPVVPRVIIGTANTLSSEDVSGISSNMALTMIQGFAHVKDGCSNTPVENLSGFLAHINDSCESSDGSTQGNSKAYAYDYLPIVSTITGAIMIYVVFSLCISVSIRAFKLIILRSIAPIPVLSYIDPKSSKDGPFAAWKKTFFSTWAELFINLGIIYFVVYIIDFMLSGDAYLGFFDNVGIIDGIFLLAFIIVGLLMFAKQAPKFVMDALGIKSKGNFTRMLGMGISAAGMVGNTASQFAARQVKNPGHALTNFGASLFGGAVSGIKAGDALMTNDKPTLLTGYNAISKYGNIASERIDKGSTVGGRLLAGVQRTIGMPTAHQINDKKIADYKAAQDAYKRMDSAFNSDGNSFFNSSNGLTGYTASNGEILVDATKSYSTKSLNDLLTRMKDSGNYSQKDIDSVDAIKKAAQAASYDRVRNVSNPSSLTGTDHEIYESVSTIFSVGKKYANDDDKVFADYKTASDVKDSSLVLSSVVKKAAYGAGREAEVIKSSDEYARNEANDTFDPKK